jgi:hypothetical protein
MQAPTPQALIKTSKAMPGRATDQRWRGIALHALRKRGLLIRLDEHRGKIGSPASLTGRGKLFPTAGSHVCHLVTLILMFARETTSGCTERCANGRNHQSQQRQAGEHGCARRSRPNWNHFAHSFIFTTCSRFQAVNGIRFCVRQKSQRRIPLGNLENRPRPAAAATEDAAQSNR